MIRLLFTRADDLVSAAICDMSGGPVSHVGIEFQGVPPRTSEHLVLSAESKGVIEQPPKLFLGGGRKLQAVYEATPEGEKHLMLWHARSLCGQKYGFNEIRGFAWVVVCKRWFRKTILNPVHDPLKWICSEIVLTLPDEQGFVVELESFLPERKESTSPWDLVRRLQAGGPTFNCVFDKTRKAA